MSFSSSSSSSSNESLAPNSIRTKQSAVLHCPVPLPLWQSFWQEGKWLIINKAHVCFNTTQRPVYTKEEGRRQNIDDDNNKRQLRHSSCSRYSFSLRGFLFHLIKCVCVCVCVCVPASDILLLLLFSHSLSFSFCVLFVRSQFRPKLSLRCGGRHHHHHHHHHNLLLFCGGGVY